MESSHNIHSVLTYFSVVFLSIFCADSYSEINDALHSPSLRMNLLVIDTIPNYLPYTEFCQRNPGECDLKGPDVVELSPEKRKAIHDTNSTVNKEIRFTLDVEQYGAEEYWTYPRSGRGDCEDKALEKRSRLVRLGIPRSTMRIAIVLHKQFLNSHCLLTIETNEGTYVLDSFSDRIMLWHQVPYNYEMRETKDGVWERYDQGIWSQ